MTNHTPSPSQDQDLRTALEAKAEEQIAYWRKRQAAEKALEEGLSEDGETYTPIGDQAAWQSGYCNGRMSEADWWLSTLKYLTPAQAPDKAGEREGVDETVFARMDKAVAAIGTAPSEDEQNDLYEAWCAVCQSLAPQPNGTEASRGVGAETEDALCLRAARMFIGWPTDFAVRLEKVETEAEAQAMARELADFLLRHRAMARAATPTPPVSPTPDSTGPDGADLPQSVYEALTFVYRGMDKIEEVAAFAREHVAYIVRSSAALTPSAPIAGPVRDDGARRPISEAPKDGTRLLCLTILGRGKNRHPEWNIGYFDDEQGEWFSEEGSDIDPSHFYDLPDWRQVRLASLPTPASDVPGEAQTQEGGR